MAIHFGVRRPPEGLLFEYFAEGAANTVWTVSFRDPQQRNQDKSLVLRLRKDLPFTIPASHSLRQFEDRIEPLFPTEPSYLVPQCLVDLSPSTIKQLDDELRRLERNGTRPEKRHNVYLPDYATEPYAIEMPNLYHRRSSGRVIEFKPKWLIPSPSAPADARRCRTCALNAMRRSQGESPGRGDGGFCPLNLLSDDDRVLRKTVRPMWQQDGDGAMLNVFVAAFREKAQPALRVLKGIQERHNQVSLDDFESVITTTAGTSPDESGGGSGGKDFSVSMALRDCSLFLLLNVNPERSSVKIDTVKFIDLDLKDTGGGKVERWAANERQLIEGGWYSDSGRTEVECSLSLSSSS